LCVTFRTALRRCRPPLFSKLIYALPKYPNCGFMAQRTIQSSRSIIVDSLVDRGFTRTEATNILSIAERFRSVGTSAQRRQAIGDYLGLSPSAADAVCDILGRWSEIASSKRTANDLSEQQADQIADTVRTSESLTEFYGRGLREMLLFMHRYVYQGMSFEESARRVGGLTPRRSR
jgi:predicted transcriptional regulator